jgi:hypothetical protein
MRQTRLRIGDFTISNLGTRTRQLASSYASAFAVFTVGGYVQYFANQPKSLELTAPFICLIIRAGCLLSRGNAFGVYVIAMMTMTLVWVLG